MNGIEVPTASATTETSISASPSAATSTTESTHHVHSANCEHPIAKQSKEKLPSGKDMEKDTRSLKASRYGEIKDKFDKTFVIENKKTGRVVELKAASSTHACKLIGWRPNNVRLIDVMEGTKNEEKVTETVEAEVEVKA